MKAGRYEKNHVEIILFQNEIFQMNERTCIQKIMCTLCLLFYCFVSVCVCFWVLGFFFKVGFLLCVIFS